jgi:GAF domain-containing protein
MFTCENNYPVAAEELYPLLKEQLQSLVMGVPYSVANLANASALLNQALRDINWVGFYLCQDGKLVLGPFQGKTACIEIPFGRGVCGTAVAKDETQLVYDVHQFPGHIACDSASNSEIVIPLHHNGKVIGVLDIDSPLIGRFDETDREKLLEIAQHLEACCDFTHTGYTL